jgi:hypothetical protein
MRYTWKLGAVDVLKVIHEDDRHVIPRLDKHVIPRLDRGSHQKNIEKWISAGVYPREIGGGNDKTACPRLDRGSTAPRKHKFLKTVHKSERKFSRQGRGWRVKRLSA